MAPWKYTDENYRDYTRKTWDESSTAYTKLLRNLEPYGFDLLARIDPKVRERCLDIATGPGEPAMSIARMVGPDGKVKKHWRKVAKAETHPAQVLETLRAGV